MSAPGWQPITKRIAAACADVGLDLVHPFNVARYQATVGEGERLDDFGRADALGILIGNTQKLWPVFLRAFGADTALSSGAQPLDTYVVTRLSALFADIVDARSKLTFSHVTTPRAFPIQRLAESVDFAALSPSHLAIHPQHGPWFALRAVAVIDIAGPELPPPALERPCRGCSAPCVPALERAVAASGTPLNSAVIAAHAADWIAVRDACPVGRASRYGAEQIEYHYAPDRSRIRLK